MTENCVGCEKDFIVCTHNVCGDDKGGFIVTHRDCDEYGCGECMSKCAGSPSEEYCEECLNANARDARADWYTYRMEMGFTE